MKDAHKPDHIALNTLITYIKAGRYQVPDFQREFEWKPWDINDLMRSIFLDYYIGSFLLWKGKDENFKTLSCERLYGVESEKDKGYIVLDGQQRLTAIHYAFVAPDKSLPNRANRAIYSIQVDQFMEEEYDKAFNYDFMSKGIKKLLSDTEQQFATHIFPLSIVGEGGLKFYNWLNQYESYWNRRVSEAEENGNEAEVEDAKKHAENAKRFGEYITELIDQYQVSYIELDKELEVDKICDIFTKINSRGVNLDIFDLINALVRPKDIKLKEMWRNVEGQFEFVGSERMNVYILQVMSILLQAYCSPKYLYYLIPGHEKNIRSDGVRKTEILISDSDDFKHLWKEAVSALESAVKQIRHPHEYGVVSSRYLPYASILPAFSSLQARAKKLPSERQLQAQRKIKYWYWASIFTQRYSGSVESTSARDFQDMQKWFEDDDAKPDLIEKLESVFNDLDLRKETKSGSSIYNGIFNLFVIKGAKDWVTGKVPQHDDLDDHHIIPAWWGRENLNDNAVNTILNRSPLTGDTNRKIIRDRLPNEYLPEWIKANNEKDVREILSSHLISDEAFEILLRKQFGADDFEDFIKARHNTMQEAIKSLIDLEAH